MTAFCSITVAGSVQGVGYRYFVYRHATDLELGGTVRNQTDGSVRVEVEGPVNQIERLLELLREGPTFAKVHHVDIVWNQVTGAFSEFQIIG